MPGNLSSKNYLQELIHVPCSGKVFIQYLPFPSLATATQSVWVLVTSASSRQPTQLAGIYSLLFSLGFSKGVRLPGFTFGPHTFLAVPLG